jgi:hypothetical protein
MLNEHLEMTLLRVRQYKNKKKLSQFFPSYKIYYESNRFSYEYAG